MGADFQGQKKMNAPAQADGKFDLFLLSVLFRPSKDWVMPTRIDEDDLLYSACKFKL